MAQEPHGRWLAWLLAAKVVCCGALLLAVTGSLSLASLASWFFEGGIVWIGLAVLMVAAVYLWRRHRADRPRSEEQGRRGQSQSAS